MVRHTEDCSIHMLLPGTGVASLPLLLLTASFLFNAALAQTTSATSSSITATDTGTSLLSSTSTTSTPASSTSEAAWDSYCIYNCFREFNVSLSICNNNDWMSSRFQCICDNCHFSSPYENRPYPDNLYGSNGYRGQLTAVYDRINNEACPSNTFKLPTPASGCPVWTSQFPYTTLAPNGRTATVIVYGDPPVSTATESPWLYYTQVSYVPQREIDRAPIIAGVTIGGIVGVGVIIGAFVRKRRRALKQKELEKDVESSSNHSATDSQNASSTSVSEGVVEAAPATTEVSTQPATPTQDISPVADQPAIEPPVYEEVRAIDREVENKTTYAVVESLRNPKGKTSGPSTQPPPYQPN